MGVLLIIRVKNSLTLLEIKDKLHNNAAGFGISGNKIDQLLQYANTKLNAADFENCYLVDYILDARENISPLIYTLSDCSKYFGNHIDEIKFVIKNIPLTNIMIMGANKDSIKISYNGIDYVHFKDANFIEEILNNKKNNLTIYGRGNINNYMGRTSIQVFIDDYEIENNDNSKYDF